MKRSNAVWILLLLYLTVFAATVRAQGVDISAPDVVFLDPKDSTVTQNASVMLRVLVRSRLPLLRIVLDVNGDAQKVKVDPATGDPNRYIVERRIQLRSGKNRIAVTAYNEKAASFPAVIVLTYEPANSGKPGLYVLAIGVSKGEESGLTVKTGARDAEAFAKLMSTQKPEDGLFGNVEVRTLINDQATREAILSELEWLRDQKKFDNDVSILFLSGNLAIDYYENSIYFLTSKYQPKTKLVVNNIRYSLFWEYLSSAKGTTVIFANTGWENEGGRFLFEKFVDSFEKDNVNSFFSARDGVATPIDKPLEYSIFTLALLDGLKGGANFGFDDAKDRIIDTHELQQWIRRRVFMLTEGRQIPVVQVQPAPVQIFKF